MGKINFFTIDTGYRLKNKKLIREWILRVLSDENNRNFDFINIILCSDDYLIEINRTFLKHDYFTDIITFKDPEIDNSFEGELYISIDRVKENSQKLGIPPENELHRVLIHGILHLCGYDDKRKNEKQFMRELEDRYLQKLNL